MLFFINMEYIRWCSIIFIRKKNKKVYFSLATKNSFLSADRKAAEILLNALVTQHLCVHFC